MSLNPQAFDHIPEETARVAKAAFPKGNVYMQMRDEFGQLYTDQAFTALFSHRGQPAEAPACLALVTIMQFAEGLSDRQAADAVRARLDWKYALALELTDPGFDASVLSEFRSRLIAGHAEHVLFETLLARLREAGLLKARERQRTDSTHVLAAIHTLNRLECVGETMRHALNTLAIVAPDWLRSQVPSEWYERYMRRFEEYRLPPGRPERYALAETIGNDGFQLLAKVYAEATPAWIRELPAVDVLRRVWLQQFYGSTLPIRWRAAEDLPPSSLLICSPYDVDARYAKKRSTEWTGYKVHLTETCEPDSPNLITNVQTTPAPVSDFDLLPVIHTQLAARGLLPDEHIVDSGYMTSDHVVTSQKEHGVDLVGPIASDTSWQGKSQTGFDAATFSINWEARTATCPQGRTSVLWMPGQDRHTRPIINIRFARTDCLACATREKCTHSPTEPRMLTVRTQECHEALQAARRRQLTEAYKKIYANRAGIEGTISQGARRGSLRCARYIGLAKTHLQQLLMATALNLLRVGAWLLDMPRSQTRRSPFAALAPAIG